MLSHFRKFKRRAYHITLTAKVLIFLVKNYLPQRIKCCSHLVAMFSTSQGLPLISLAIFSFAFVLKDAQVARISRLANFVARKCLKHSASGLMGVGAVAIFAFM